METSKESWEKARGEGTAGLAPHSRSGAEQFDGDTCAPSEHAYKACVATVARDRDVLPIEGAMRDAHAIACCRVGYERVFPSEKRGYQSQH